MKLMFWVLLSSLIGSMIVAPQAVAAWEMPSLVLERARVQEALENDRAQASGLPSSAEVVRLQSLFLEHGQREADGSDTRAEHDRRQLLISRGIEELERSGGPELITALRANATERLMHEFPQAEPGRLGAFPQMLQKYGLVHDGVLIAPEITVRAVYKARWNVIHQRPLVEGLRAIERQAYWGWVALHAPMFPVERRIDALMAFAEAGGSGVDEAAAMFALIEQHPNQAIGPLEQLYEDSGRIRFRNLALGARAVAQRK